MDKNYRQGIMYGLGAYCLWGILPIYWKLLQHVSALEILANRFIWSAVFVFFLLLVTGKFKVFLSETAAVFSKFKTGTAMLAAAVTISFNWGIFIWAVEAGRIVESSMGYYINPLVSVLFGMVFLREKLDKLQWTAVICAVIGIAIMLVKNGSLPWVSVSLAFTFALYGLLKKIIPVSAMTSIMLETLLIMPVAIGYLYFLSTSGDCTYQSGDLLTISVLIGAGAVTATPLLLFTSCAKLLPLKIVGFMQYLSPTISLFLGIFVYGEVFTSTHMLSFGCIWLGLLFFTWSQIRLK